MVRLHLGVLILIATVQFFGTSASGFNRLARSVYKTSVVETRSDTGNRIYPTPAR